MRDSTGMWRGYGCDNSRETFNNILKECISHKVKHLKIGEKIIQMKSNRVYKRNYKSRAQIILLILTWKMVIVGKDESR